MSPKTVLITGINGYLASNAARAVLQAGHNIRGTCRSLSRVTALLEGAWKQYASQIDIAIVPDITVPTAFDDAVKGVTSIMHMAAPAINPNITNPTAQLIDPTITGTENLLASALAHAGPQLEIFILASSAGACITPNPNPPYTHTSSTWNITAETIYAEQGSETPLFTAYPVAKIRAERALFALGKSSSSSSNPDKPAPFALTSICGSIATGPPIRLPMPGVDGEEESIPPTCKSILNALRGVAVPGPQEHIAVIAGAAPYTDIRDIAAVYLWCVEHAEKADGKRYLVVAGHGPHQAVYDILREAYPERSTVLPQGDQEFRYNGDWSFDEGGVGFEAFFIGQGEGKTRAEVWRDTGIQPRGYRETVLDTAEALDGFWKGSGYYVL